MHINHKVVHRPEGAIAIEPRYRAPKTLSFTRGHKPFFLWNIKIKSGLFAAAPFGTKKQNYKVLASNFPIEK